MQVKTGIDIIQISRLQKAIDRSGEKFLKKIFLPEELSDNKTQHLAGIYAAKEAIIKALSLSPGCWLDIFINNEKTGRPKYEIKNLKFKILSSDLSISHDGDYAVAVVIILLH